MDRPWNKNSLYRVVSMRIMLPCQVMRRIMRESHVIVQTGDKHDNITICSYNDEMKWQPGINVPDLMGSIWESYYILPSYSISTCVLTGDSNGSVLWCNPYSNITRDRYSIIIACKSLGQDINDYTCHIKLNILHALWCAYYIQNHCIVTYVM